MATGLTRYISPNGNNSNSGTSFASSWLSLGYALSQISSIPGNHTIICDDGDYAVETSSIEVERNYGETLTIRLREDATADAVFESEFTGLPLVSFAMTFTRSSSLNDNYTVNIYGIDESKKIVFKSNASADQMHFRFNGSLNLNYVDFGPSYGGIQITPVPSDDSSRPLYVDIKNSNIYVEGLAVEDTGISAGSGHNLALTATNCKIYGAGSTALSLSTGIVLFGGGTFSLTGCDVAGMGTAFMLGRLASITGYLMNGDCSLTGCRSLENITAVSFASTEDVTINNSYFSNSYGPSNQGDIFISCVANHTSANLNFVNCKFRTANNALYYYYGTNTISTNITFDRCYIDGSKKESSSRPYMEPIPFGAHTPDLTINSRFYSCVISDFNNQEMGVTDFQAPSKKGSAAFENCTYTQSEKGLSLHPGSSVRLINNVIHANDYHLNIEAGASYPNDFDTRNNIFVGTSGGGGVFSIEEYTFDYEVPTLSAAGIDSDFLLPIIYGLSHQSGSTSSNSLISINDKIWREYGDQLIDRGAFSYIYNDIKLSCPQITVPIANGIYNLGYITVSWDIPNNPSEDEAIDIEDVTYELEYTENYCHDETVWSAITRRISGTSTQYLWKYGNMLKGNQIRIRIRARHLPTGVVSDWDMSHDFRINVYDLIPPFIISPQSGESYSNSIYIMIDESQTTNTYNQKVRYKFEYSSKKLDIDWTTIKEDIPPGENIIMWDVTSLNPSSDYALKLSVVGAPEEDETTQYANAFIYDISILSPGSFVIDTQPPKAVLKSNLNNQATNELNQIIDIYAEDETTEVTQMQIRECDATFSLLLGNNNEEPETTDCPSISELLDEDSDKDNLIGKAIPYTPKLNWKFTDESGIKKLEALFTDAGGNISIQENSVVFLPSFSSSYQLTDILVTTEQRENTTLTTDSEGEAIIGLETALLEVAYIANNGGELWILEPLPRLVYSFANNINISKINKFNDSVYMSCYSTTNGQGYLYRLDSTESTLIYNFPNNKSISDGLEVFNNALYIGLRNGELWKYDGINISKIKTFSEAIKSLSVGVNVLYIGLYNSNSVYIYNGSSFFEQTIN